MSITAIVAISCVVLFFVFYGMYTNVIKAKNKVEEAYSGIDVQLKKRYDLIPNLLTIAKTFMEHEKEVFTKITELRTAALKLSDNFSDINKKIELEKEIRNQMSKFMVSVENYPQLKSDATMAEAMKAYQDIEEHLSAARRFYNSAVYQLNNMVEIFPSSIIAAMCNIQKCKFFEADEAEKKPVNASDYFNK